MISAPFQWLAKNISTLLLAVVLSMIVWVSAVVTADPNEEQTSKPIKLEITGLDPGLMIVGDIPNQVRLTLVAPKSIWNRINDNPELLNAWIDLSGYEPGDYVVEIKTSFEPSPVRFVRVDPQEVQLNLEKLVSRRIPVEINVQGDVPIGYRKETLALDPSEVSIIGSESAVNRVSLAQARLNIAGATQTIQETVPIDLLDENGDPVSNVDLNPQEVSVSLPISLLGGFKNVAVKVATSGQVAEGYRLTNITVTPPTVTVFSDDPRLVEELPGFVETLPVVLTDLTDDSEISVGLNLPQGVTPVREPNVLVQISVAAIEGSRTFSVPVLPTGLSPDLMATISPEIVDVIAAGPLNLLEELTASDFQVYVDLEGLPVGIYQRPPTAEVIPDQVRVQTTLPDTVEVNISLAPTPTITPVVSPTPSPTTTP